MSLSMTYRRRLAAHCCTRCGEQMPPEHKSRDCSACLRAHRQGRDGRVEIAARRNAQIARIVETAKAMSSREQASDMGVTEERVRYLRTMARRLGHDVPKEVGGTKAGAPFTAHESPRWKELESFQGYCRCGLRLPCNSCIPSILEVASSRRGPGRVYPTGGPGGLRAGEKQR